MKLRAFFQKIQSRGLQAKVEQLEDLHFDFDDETSEKVKLPESKAKETTKGVVA